MASAARAVAALVGVVAGAGVAWGWQASTRAKSVSARASKAERPATNLLTVVCTCHLPPERNTHEAPRETRGSWPAYGCRALDRCIV